MFPWQLLCCYGNFYVATGDIRHFVCIVKLHKHVFIIAQFSLKFCSLVFSVTCCCIKPCFKSLFENIISFPGFFLIFTEIKITSTCKTCLYHNLEFRYVTLSLPNFKCFQYNSTWDTSKNMKAFSNRNLKIEHQLSV